jgi:TorA maturation chaperone TorD
LADALELGELPQAEEYTELFLFQLFPYASIYLGSEGKLGGEAQDRIAGFWRAIGQTPPNEPDHLTTLLAMYAEILKHEESAVAELARGSWRNASRAFLWEHLLSWMPFYLDRVESMGQPFYQRWSALLKQALIDQSVNVGAQTSLPVHLRNAPTLADPREHGFTAFLDSLLAPVRSGLIITRRDISQAAVTLGLGSRIAERRFALTALIKQDAKRVLGWLSRSASEASAKHASYHAQLGPVAEFWAGRARETGRLLEELSLQAE